ncbi:MAG: alpha/beta hydrolase [Bacteriovoracales bacterium]|nr:alpha/beta hydrolase [Bacteriovoracales bacterium]
MTAKKNIVFSHANGFPAKSYKTFFEYFDGFHIKYIEAYGKSTYPIDRNWHSSARELIDFVEKNFSSPVTALGHSFGGAVSLFACAQRPDLFDKVVVIEPPLFGPGKRWPIGLLRLINLHHLLFPLPRWAKRRRNSFPSTEEAVAYFQKRPLFKNFDPRCLQDYAQAGLVKEKEGDELGLFIPRELESGIFDTMPCFFLPKMSKMKPTTILYAKSLLSYKRDDLRWFKKAISPLWLFPYDGGHMAPLEHPERIAKLVMEIMSRSTAK